MCKPNTTAMNIFLTELPAVLSYRQFFAAPDRWGHNMALYNQSIADTVNAIAATLKSESNCSAQWLDIDTQIFFTFY